MEFWSILFWGFVILCGIASLYGLHRLCLWLESRGLLYYKHKKSTSSAAGCFVALQQALEPQTQHVLQVGEEKRHYSSEETPGDDAARFGASVGDTKMPDQWQNG